MSNIFDTTLSHEQAMQTLGFLIGKDESKAFADKSTDNLNQIVKLAEQGLTFIALKVVSDNMQDEVALEDHSYTKGVVSSMGCRRFNIIGLGKYNTEEMDDMDSKLLKVGTRVEFIEEDFGTIGIINEGQQGTISDVDEHCMVGLTYLIEVDDGGEAWVEEHEIREIMVDDKVFAKDDLRTGMVVEYRCGEKATVLIDNAYGYDALISIDGSWMDIYEYNNDMTLCQLENNSLDITKVYKPQSPGSMITMEDDKLELIWECNKVATVLLFGDNRDHWRIPSDLEVDVNDIVIVETHSDFAREKIGKVIAIEDEMAEYSDNYSIIKVLDIK